MVPRFSVGRVGEHEVELQVGKAVTAKGGAVLDVLGLLAFYQHVRCADGVGFGVHFLPVQVKARRAAGDLLGKVFGFGQHTAGAAGRVVHEVSALLYFILHRQEQEVRHQLDDFPWRKVFAGFFVVLLVEFANEFFKHVTHSEVGERRQRFAPAVFAFHRREVDVGTRKLFNEQKGDAGVPHGFELVAQLELGDDFLNVGAKAVEVEFKVGVYVGFVVEQGFKGVAALVPKGEAALGLQGGFIINVFLN